MTSGLPTFDAEVFEPSPNPAVRRRLVGVGRGFTGGALPGEERRTGSAALECALVAAGLMAAARFETPNVWDVAGGIPLVQAAGAVVLADRGEGWAPFETFLPEQEGADLRAWAGRIALAAPEITQTLADWDD